MLVINQDSAQLGVMPVETAIKLAEDAGFDLVEVAPDKTPPVCRIMNYGKFRYEQLKKDREDKRKQKIITIKEIKIRPKIEKHDYETKLNHVKRFLEHGDKVRVTVMFRGREMAHQEFGTKLLNRVAQDLSEMAVLEQKSKVEENNMVVLFAPKVAKEPVKDAPKEKVKEEKSAKDKNA